MLFPLQYTQRKYLAAKISDIFLSQALKLQNNCQAGTLTYCLLKLKEGNICLLHFAFLKLRVTLEKC